MGLTFVPLPSDVVTAKSFSKEAMAEEKVLSDIEDDDIVMDVGPETRSHFSNLIREMNTVIWNGPREFLSFLSLQRGLSQSRWLLQEWRFFNSWRRRNSNHN